MRNKEMSLEDALAILNPETSIAKLAEYEYYGGFNGKAAVDKAISDARQIACVSIKFQMYFDTLYGQGLEIANWHLNGETEPFDNFYENALEEQ
jgi:hypothetical protein